MKKIINTIVLMLAISVADAQQSQDTRTQGNTSSTAGAPIKFCHSYALGVTPVGRSTVIYGLALGVYAGPTNNKSRLVINGVNIEADPIPPIGVLYFGIMMLPSLPQLFKTESDTGKAEAIVSADDTVIKTKINGLSISSGLTERKTRMNGVALNAIWGIENEMNGFEVTSILNWHTSFKGVIVAFANTVAKGKGVQIGIYNYCGDGKVVQIGLLNRIGKRTLPFVNFRFKKEKIN